MTCGRFTREQFSQYVKICADNVLDKEQKQRFDYNKLRHALKAVEQADYGRVPRDVMELFSKITGFVFPAEQLKDREQVILMLTMLNVHMSYVLLNDLLLATYKDAKLHD